MLCIPESSGAVVPWRFAISWIAVYISSIVEIRLPMTITHEAAYKTAYSRKKPW